MTREEGRLRDLQAAWLREWGRWRSVVSYRKRELPVRHTPLQLWIEPTNKCNLRCVMCINSVVSKQRSGFMSLELYRSLIEQAALWRPKPQISLFLGGESTLHRDLSEMIAIAARLQLPTFLATNATTLTPERSEDLIACGLDNIIFSFDGYDKASFEAVRVGAEYERTLGNIRAFLEIKQRRRSPTPHVTFYSLITRSLAAESERAKLTEFQRVFEGLPVDQFSVRLAGHWGGTFDGVNSADYQEAVTYGDRFFPCFRLWESMSILWDGTVVPCCVDFVGELPLGDATRERLLDIWNGERMLAHRGRMVAQRIDQVALCTKGERGCEVPWPPEVMCGAPLSLLPHTLARLSTWHRTSSGAV
jgi:pyruvate-formate lyase-activating enzyme